MKKVILFSLIFTCSFAFAQKTEKSDLLTSENWLNKKVTLYLFDKSEIKGKVIKETDLDFTIETEFGVSTVRRNSIKEIEEIDPNKKFSFDNPHPTRYFFAPSGIPIDKGTGYYQNLMLTTNFINYGVTDHFSIGGGFEFISLVLGLPIVFITPKFGTKIADDLYLSSGAFLIFSSDIIAGIPFVTGTYGGKESNISLGIGYTFANGEISQNPVLSFSATHRIHDNFSLLTENYFISSSSFSTYFGIHGIRAVSKRNAFDFGAIVIPEIAEYIPALPYVGYSRAF